MNFEPMYVDSEPGLLAMMLYPLACCWAQRKDSVSVLKERYKQLGNPHAEKIAEVYYTGTCPPFGV